nr:MAG TPA: hypothetical protein [Bacteriophage sp.]
MFISAGVSDPSILVARNGIVLLVDGYGTLSERLPIFFVFSMLSSANISDILNVCDEGLYTVQKPLL